MYFLIYFLVSIQCVHGIISCDQLSPEQNHWQIVKSCDGKETGRPNPEEYRRMESVLDDLRRRKIVVYPFAGLFGRGSDFPSDPSLQNMYIEYTLARLGAYWNLIYMVGGPEPLLPKKTYLSEQKIDRIARKIKDTDIYGHLLSTHNYTGDDLYKNYPWHDYGILQGPKTTDRKKLSEVILKNHCMDRPLYLQETLWPGNTFGHPAYSLEDIRKNGIVMLFSGGAINFGDMSGSSSSGFSGKIDFSLKVQERHDVIHQVWDYFETLPWHEATPHQELVNTGYCLARPGSQYLVYLEESDTLLIDLQQGNFTGQWINARNFQVESIIEKISSGNSLYPPGRGEWILYLLPE